MSGRASLWTALVTAALGLANAASAHQPVMDMAPRWAGGSGLQVRHEYRSSDDLLDGRRDADGPSNRERRVRTTWLEGVYTFQRSARVTAKVPYIDQERVTSSGERQSGEGLGDVILGVPLKRYRNEGRATWNWGVTPSVRLPTGSTSGDYPVGDGSWDAGISFGYVRETPRAYQYVDWFYWRNGSGRKGIHRGDVIGLDLNLGIHPLHDSASNSGVYLMWDVSARYEARGRGSVGTTGGKRVSTGPILVACRIVRGPL